MTRVNLLAIALLLGLAGACSDSKPNDLKFDADIWKASGTRERGQMVGELVASQSLRGKSRDEVVQLLGVPDRSGVRYISYEFSYGSIVERIVVSRLYVIVEFDDSGQTAVNVTLGDA